MCEREVLNLVVVAFKELVSRWIFVFVWFCWLLSLEFKILVRFCMFRNDNDKYRIWSCWFWRFVDILFVIFWFWIFIFRIILLVIWFFSFNFWKFVWEVIFKSFRLFFKIWFLFCIWWSEFFRWIIFCCEVWFKVFSIWIFFFSDCICSFKVECCCLDSFCLSL